MGIYKKLFGGRCVFRKFIHDKPLSEKIRVFNEKYPDRDAQIPVRDLLIWHHVLTSSCNEGRIKFCEEHNIDYENGTMSVNEFIETTRDGYGGSTIKKLEKSFNKE